jgi:pimeloyl-ACP methyl ester carboxylesterase
VGTLFITVHGTGDQAAAVAGEEAKWWQPDSPFCTELLAAAPAGSRIEPFIWSGANDELHRRKAGLKLLARLRAAADEPITVIGHSHGGSVIATALRYAAARRQQLPNLRKWVTVGSPFILMKPDAAYWRRFNVYGQALLIAAALTFVIAAVGVRFLYNTFAVSIRDENWFDAVYYSTAGQSAWASVSALIIFITLLWFSQRGVAALHAKRNKRRFSEAFADRWIGTAARLDEATGGLTKLARLHLKVFDHGVLTGALRGAAAILLFIYSAFYLLIHHHIAALLLFSFSSNATSADQKSAQFALDADFLALQERTYFLYSWLDKPLDKLTYSMLGLEGGFNVWLANLIGNYDTVTWIVYALYPITVTLIAFAALVGCLALVSLAGRFVIGPLAASALNEAANSAIKKRALGNTTTGERAVGVSLSPFEEIQANTSMPAEVDASLETFAREHAGETLAKVHEEIFRADAKPVNFLSQAVMAHLSWRELIHTAYFKTALSRAFIVSLAR